MGKEYFSDRERGPQPRVEQEVQASAWGGIVALLEGLVSDGSLGIDYPAMCADAPSIPFGTHEEALALSLGAEVPDAQRPWSAEQVPETIAILDLIEFCHEHVAEPIRNGYHPFMRHYHLEFDRQQGRSTFGGRVNRIFARNGLAYELGQDGRVVRLAGPVLSEALAAAIFDTGDADLNSLLETARRKFLDPDPDVRRESLEQLWDAWERIKTLEDPNPKRKAASIQALLAKASPGQPFYDKLEEEAAALTGIGNQFRIRHSEVYVHSLEFDAHVDYLFHRLFALIQLLLRAREGGIS